MKSMFAVILAIAAAGSHAQPLEKRSPGPGPVCIPPTYGCGTELAPKCCEPSEKRSPGVGPVCIPPTYGCGTELAPKCCEPSEKRSPGPGPVCIPPTYGCGTELKPKCCEPEEKRQIVLPCPPGNIQCGNQPDGRPRCCLTTAGPCGATLMPSGCYCVSEFEYTCEP